MIIAPIFIFSLPRSGSTLLQRSLMVHKNITSTSEPWILLPQIYCLKNNGQLSDYGSLPASRGLNDLINNLPNKKEDYNESLKIFILGLYRKLALNNETYFLDKTPRYYKIITEIEEVFPDAKFIFLFRSPEQIYASMLKTWSNNRFRPFLSSYYDLIEGNTKLSDGYKKIKNKSLAIKYEDFVSNPDEELIRITNYLEIDFDPKMSNDFNIQKTKGRLGDPTGVVSYSKISNQSIDKWKTIFNTRLRKIIAVKIINRINIEALEVQGYDKKIIIKAVKAIKPKRSFIFRDLLDYNIDWITRKFNLHLYFNKGFKWKKKKYLY